MSGWFEIEQFKRVRDNALHLSSDCAPAQGYGVVAKNVSFLFSFEPEPPNETLTLFATTDEHQSKTRASARDAPTTGPLGPVRPLREAVCWSLRSRAGLRLLDQRPISGD